MTAADLDLVLPNIGRFYTVGSTAPPIGFLANAIGPMPSRRFHRDVDARRDLRPTRERPR